jgi:hypothetical protein
MSCVAQWLAYASPADASPPTSRPTAHGSGPARCANLHRKGLSPHTPCRSPGALRRHFHRACRRRTKSMNPLDGHFGGTYTARTTQIPRARYKYRAHDTNLKATLRRSIAQVKGKLQLRALPSGRLHNWQRLALYQRLLLRLPVIISNAQDEPPSVRLATCLDRGRWATGTCRDGTMAPRSRSRPIARSECHTRFYCNIVFNASST